MYILPMFYNSYIYLTQRFQIRDHVSLKLDLTTKKLFTKIDRYG